MTTQPNDLTPAEQAAVRFAQEWRYYQRGDWRVVNDDGYESTMLEESEAKRCAAIWPAPPDKPYRAEPWPRPTLEEIK